MGAKLDRIAAFDRQDTTFDPRAEMAADRAVGWSYRVASTKGVHGRVGDDDRAAMAKAGLAASEIAGVGDCLDAMQRSGALAPSRARISELVEEVGALPSPGNLAQAQAIYLRALGEALLRTTDRYVSDALPFDTLMASHGADFVEASIQSDEAGPNTSNALINPAPPPPSPAATIEAIGAKLTADKRQDKEWDEKTCRQAEFIFGLFGRFLLEEHGLSDLAELRQTHCDAFDGFLRGLFKSVGKSPRDKDRSKAEQLEWAASGQGASASPSLRRIGRLSSERRN